MGDRGHKRAPKGGGARCPFHWARWVTM